MSFMHGRGTDGYISPEMVRKKRIKEKLDVYSFGIIMYELLTGNRAPYVNCVDTEMIDVFFFRDVKGYHKHMPEWFYQQWRGLKSDCMAYKAARRQAFTEVVARLRHMLAALKIIVDNRSVTPKIDQSFAKTLRVVCLGITHFFRSTYCLFN